MDIEGLSLQDWKALTNAEQDTLLAFGKPLAFHMGSARVLAEFNRFDDDLIVNLAHIDGGGEGVVVVLWKAVQAYAAARGYGNVQWNVHALTCERPNPRLQRFLRRKGFVEVEDEKYGWIFVSRSVKFG